MTTSTGLSLVSLSSDLGVFATRLLDDCPPSTVAESSAERSTKSSGRSDGAAEAAVVRVVMASAAPDVTAAHLVSGLLWRRRIYEPFVGSLEGMPMPVPGRVVSKRASTVVRGTYAVRGARNSPS